MDKFKKIYYSDSHRKIRNKINDFLEDNNQELEEKIMTTILKYQKTKKVNKKDIEEMQNFIYKILTEVYKITSSELKNIYKTLPEFDVKDILKLTFKKDGKSLDKRIEEYLNEIPEKYKYNIDITKDSIKAVMLTFTYLKTKLDRVIITESYNMETQVKKIKKPVTASVLIIEAGCGDLCTGGEFPADEDVDLPPFHPYCQCISYFDETDDLNDIEDLDLEVEE